MGATGTMARCATALLASLDAGQARTVRGRLGETGMRQWTYLPGPRPGLSLEDLDEHQHALAMELLDAVRGESDADARGAIAVERFRRRLGAGDGVAGPDRYWFRVLGEPGAGPWGWRVNGHHLAVHVTVVGDRFTVTPHFLGAEPAVLPSGPMAGHRLLGPEEDLARELLAALDADRRAVAVVAPTAPRDILTRADPVADPSVLPVGLAHADMSSAQQPLLVRLLRRYLDRSPPEYAETCWREVLDAGLDRVSFAWAGPLRRGEGHYYCLTGPTLLVEYDNTQDGANHAHSVWRHRRDDWGEDLLRRHYARHHDSSPSSS